jgi:hypothetical protein
MERIVYRNFIQAKVLKDRPLRKIGPVLFVRSARRKNPSLQPVYLKKESFEDRQMAKYVLKKPFLMI